MMWDRTDATDLVPTYLSLLLLAPTAQRCWAVAFQAPELTRPGLTLSSG